MSRSKLSKNNNHIKTIEVNILNIFSLIESRKTDYNNEETRSILKATQALLETLKKFPDINKLPDDVSIKLIETFAILVVLCYNNQMLQTQNSSIDSILEYAKDWIKYKNIISLFRSARALYHYRIVEAQEIAATLNFQELENTNLSHLKNWQYNFSSLVKAVKSISESIEILSPYLARESIEQITPKDMEFGIIELFNNLCSSEQDPIIFSAMLNNFLTLKIFVPDHLEPEYILLSSVSLHFKKLPVLKYPAYFAGIPKFQNDFIFDEDNFFTVQISKLNYIKITLTNISNVIRQEGNPFNNPDHIFNILMPHINILIQYYDSIIGNTLTICSNLSKQQLRLLTENAADSLTYLHATTSIQFLAAKRIYSAYREIGDTTGQSKYLDRIRYILKCHRSSLELHKAQAYFTPNQLSEFNKNNIPVSLIQKARYSLFVENNFKEAAGHYQDAIKSFPENSNDPELVVYVLEYISELYIVSTAVEIQLQLFYLRRIVEYITIALSASLTANNHENSLICLEYLIEGYKKIIDQYIIIRKQAPLKEASWNILIDAIDKILESYKDLFGYANQDNNICNSIKEIFTRTALFVSVAPDIGIKSRIINIASKHSRIFAKLFPNDQYFNAIIALTEKATLQAEIYPDAPATMIKSHKSKKTSKPKTIIQKPQSLSDSDFDVLKQYLIDDNFDSFEKKLSATQSSLSTMQAKIIVQTIDTKLLELFKNLQYVKFSDLDEAFKSILKLIEHANLIILVDDIQNIDNINSIISCYSIFNIFRANTKISNSTSQDKSILTDCNNIYQNYKELQPAIICFYIRLHLAETMRIYSLGQYDRAISEAKKLETGIIDIPKGDFSSIISFTIAQAKIVIAACYIKSASALEYLDISDTSRDNLIYVRDTLIKSNKSLKKAIDLLDKAALCNAESKNDNDSRIQNSELEQHIKEEIYRAKLLISISKQKRSESIQEHKEWQETLNSKPKSAKDAEKEPDELLAKLNRTIFSEDYENSVKAVEDAADNIESKVSNYNEQESKETQNILNQKISAKTKEHSNSRSSCARN